MQNSIYVLAEKKMLSSKFWVTNIEGKIKGAFLIQKI